jgi:CMP-N,N'-diacetyllegionaminic acid synthase
MIAGRSVLGLITARGGSKGYPGKNLALLGGRSLIAWTAQAALNSKLLDRVVISSDDADIIKAARAAGCEAPFTRPAELAGDDSTHPEVIAHALAEINEAFDYFVLLQPTSPLRTPEDIDNCIETCDRTGAPSVVSVTQFDKNPGTIVSLDAGNQIHRVMEGDNTESRRQDSSTYLINGAVYVCRREWWQIDMKFVGNDSVAYVMPQERSVDIDSEADFVIAEAMLLHFDHNPKEQIKR